MVGLRVLALRRSGFRTELLHFTNNGVSGTGVRARQESPLKLRRLASRFRSSSDSCRLEGRLFSASMPNPAVMECGAHIGSRKCKPDHAVRD